MRNIFLIAFSICLFWACTPYDDQFIEGKWQAVTILEEGKPLEVNLDAISLSFDGKENYQYTSTLNYREEGSYLLDDKYLITTDTVNQASTEKAVEILKLTADSLFLKMNDNGKERLLKLKKVK